MSILQAGIVAVEPETHRVDAIGNEICPNGTTCYDSKCPVETCTCEPGTCGVLVVPAY